MTHFGKVIIFLIILAILGIVSLALYKGGKESQINEEMIQAQEEVIQEPVDEDVSAKVVIECLFGKKHTVSAVDASIVFNQSEFDATGEFINYERKAELEEACGVTEKERLEALEEEYKIAKKAKTNEVTVLPLFKVQLSSDSKSDDTLEQ